MHKRSMLTAAMFTSAAVLTSANPVFTTNSFGLPLATAASAVHTEKAANSKANAAVTNTPTASAAPAAPLTVAEAAKAVAAAEKAVAKATADVTAAEETLQAAIGVAEDTKDALIAAQEVQQQDATLRATWKTQHEAAAAATTQMLTAQTALITAKEKAAHANRELTKAQASYEAAKEKDIAVTKAKDVLDDATVNTNIVIRKIQQNTKDVEATTQALETAEAKLTTATATLDKILQEHKVKESAELSKKLNEKSAQITESSEKEKELQEKHIIAQVAAIKAEKAEQDIARRSEADILNDLLLWQWQDALTKKNETKAEVTRLAKELAAASATHKALIPEVEKLNAAAIAADTASKEKASAATNVATQTQKFMELAQQSQQLNQEHAALEAIRKEKDKLHQAAVLAAGNQLPTAQLAFTTAAAAAQRAAAEVSEKEAALADKEAAAIAAGKLAGQTRTQLGEAAALAAAVTAKETELAQAEAKVTAAENALIAADAALRAAQSALENAQKNYQDALAALAKPKPTPDPAPKPDDQVEKPLTPEPQPEPAPKPAPAPGNTEIQPPQTTLPQEQQMPPAPHIPQDTPQHLAKQSQQLAQTGGAIGFSMLAAFAALVGGLTLRRKREKISTVGIFRERCFVENNFPQNRRRKNALPATGNFLKENDG